MLVNINRSILKILTKEPQNITNRINTFMPGFPCDSSDDGFIPDEMYDGVRDQIRTQRQKLGRSLTEEEIAEIYITEGLEPPREAYRNGRTYVDYGFDMEEFEEEIYDGVKDKIECKTKELGRYLTEEEIEACFIAEGIEPPLNCYEDAYGNDEGEEGYVRIKFKDKPNKAEENDSENPSQLQTTPPALWMDEDDSRCRTIMIKQYHMEKLLKKNKIKAQGEDTLTHQPDAPVKLQSYSTEDTNGQIIAGTQNQPDSIEELMALHGITRRMAEYFAAAQRIAQESGVTATLVPQNKDHSTTPKTRFVFLAEKPQTDYEQNSTKQE
jgi:hypothetical protein